MILLSSILWFATVFAAVWYAAPVWDLVAARQVRDLTPKLHDLRMRVDRLPLYLRYWGTAMVFTVLVLGPMLGMWPLAIVAVALIYFAPRTILAILVARRRRLLRDQMVGASVGLANSARAGLSLAQGLEAICNDTPQPLAGELRRVVFEWQRGRPLVEAIEEVRLRLDLDGFTLFALAITACIDRGGNVSDALVRISHSLLENQRLERKLEADTASGRKLVVILAAFPMLFLGGFYFLDSEGTGRLFSTTPGQIALIIVIGMVVIGVQWCRRILAIEV